MHFLLTPHYFEHEPYRTIKVVKNLFNNAPLVSNDVVNLL